MTAPEIRPATDEEIAEMMTSAVARASRGESIPAPMADQMRLITRIRQLEAERESNNYAFVDMNAVFEAVMRAIRGEALSEFDESHGAVHEAKALRAAAHERDRQIAAQAEEIERLKKREAGLEDALRQFRKVLGPFATKSALALLDAALDAALKPESKE